MGDAPFDDFTTTRFATMIRKSVHEVVEATLARASGTVALRHDIRAAGERLGNALVAYADVPDRFHTTPSRAADERELPSGDESERHAVAFRAMAGVRI